MSSPPLFLSSSTLPIFLHPFFPSVPLSLVMSSLIILHNFYYIHHLPQLFPDPSPSLPTLICDLFKVLNVSGPICIMPTYS